MIFVFRPSFSGTYFFVRIPLRRKKLVGFLFFELRKTSFPHFPQSFQHLGKTRLLFLTIQHFSCGIQNPVFLVFVYFGFLWKLKGIFWKLIIPFVYRGAHRNVENPVENVKKRGFYSPHFHIGIVYTASCKNCSLNPPRRIYKKYPPFRAENTMKIQQKKSILPSGFRGLGKVFRWFSTKKSTPAQGKPAQNGGNPQGNVVK